MGLEQSLEQTAVDADVALAAASEVSRCLRRLRRAAQLGLIREISKAFESAQQAAGRLQNEVSQRVQGSAFSEPDGWDRGAYMDELLAMARQMGVEVYKENDLLYCYPSLVRVLPNEPTAFIDKRREKRLRPSVLLECLKSLQRKPPRFNSNIFLESIHDVYVIAVKTRPKRRRGVTIPLAEVYDLFTKLPTMKREYSRDEFARDLCLLDDSDIRKTRNNATVHLHPARGSESPGKIFSTVAKDGRLLSYYGVSFDGEG